MCELYGMSATHPVGTRLSFGRFAEHGGPHRRQADGWGLAMWEGLAVRLLKEPEAAVDSPWVRLVAGLDLEASTLVAHVRRATRGGRSLSNTQPFCRELHGRHHVFAHNGDLGQLILRPDTVREPIGDTDSERAFCLLLERIRSAWGRGHIPELEERARIVLSLAESLAARGPFNFLYGDGDALFAYADRRAPLDAPEPRPGLWLQEQRCTRDAPVTHHGLTHTTESPNRLVRIASVPLDDAPWRALPRGTLVVLRGGIVALKKSSCGGSSP